MYGRQGQDHSQEETNEEDQSLHRGRNVVGGRASRIDSSIRGQLQIHGDAQAHEHQEQPGHADYGRLGDGSITLYPARRQVCYSITVHSVKLPATGAYIKSQKKGSVSSTVVTLGAPGSSGTSSGCTRKGLSRSTINTIHTNYSQYYVVVTTTNYPVGALRGNL